jgi:high frequency lysogenization protein
MSTPNNIDKVLALSGVFQAAALVKQLAKTGKINEPYFQASIESLFKFDAVDVADVYNGSDNIMMGLQELVRMFSNSKNPKDSDMARYVLSMLHIERKLAKKSNMLELIRTGMLRAKGQTNYFSTTHENVLANLAGVYTDTLSTLSFKIYITGEPLYLTQTTTMNKVRSLLLAGIRSSVLWRQLGGRRWQLLISRRTILETAQKLLTTQMALNTQDVQ